MHHQGYRIRLLEVFCALLVLAGCASDGIPVSVAFDPLARFPVQATYVWDRDAIRMPTDPRIVEMRLGRLIEQVAEQAFAARGYSRTHDVERADYSLSYDFRVGTFIAADASRSTGALSFLLVDPATKGRLWLGWGRADFHAGTPTEQRRERLADALDRMLADFPPRQLGPE